VASVQVATPPLPKQNKPEKKRTYEEALRLYERALTALQHHQYSGAATLLNQVIDGFPEERELHDRARLYLKVCERQSASTQPAPPQTIEERLNAATVAMNSGAFDDAIRLLHGIEKADPENDYAQYMLAVAHVLNGRLETALPHLKRAVQLNPENRGLARQDPDLDPLRALSGFRDALEAAPLPSARRRPARGRAR
jgi:tetratricopeptide (TPR) repeat protein